MRPRWRPRSWRFPAARRPSTSRGRAALPSTLHHATRLGPSGPSLPGGGRGTRAPLPVPARRPRPVARASTATAVGRPPTETRAGRLLDWRGDPAPGVGRPDAGRPAQTCASSRGSTREGLPPAEPGGPPATGWTCSSRAGANPRRSPEAVVRPDHYLAPPRDRPSSWRRSSRRTGRPRASPDPPTTRCARRGARWRASVPTQRALRLALAPAAATRRPGLRGPCPTWPCAACVRSASATLLEVFDLRD